MLKFFSWPILNDIKDYFGYSFPMCTIDLYYLLNMFYLNCQPSNKINYGMNDKKL